jgi:hypothetical protein
VTCFFCAAPPSYGPFDACAKLVGSVAFRNPAPIWSVAESGPMPSPVGNDAEMLAYVRETLSKSKLVEDFGASARAMGTRRDGLY